MRSVIVVGLVGLESGMVVVTGSGTVVVTGSGTVVVTGSGTVW